MVITGIPPGIHRVPAQRLARQELGGSAFHESWVQRLANALSRLLGRLTDGHLHVAGWAVVTGLVVVVLLVAGIVFALAPARRASRRAAAAAVLGGGAVSAADHRRAAQRLAAAGDLAEAIAERVRAIAADLEQRGVLAPRPGRTADELAAEAAPALPPQAVPDGAARLRAAARLFDDVRYGGRHGTPDGYRQVTELDEAIRSARLASADPLTPDTAHAGTAHAGTTHQAGPA